MFNDGIQLGSRVSIDNKALRRTAKLVKQGGKLARAMADVLLARAEVLRAQASLQFELNRNKDRDIELARLELEASRDMVAAMVAEQSYRDEQAQKLAEVFRTSMSSDGPFSMSGDGLFGGLNLNNKFGL